MSIYHRIFCDDCRNYYSLRWYQFRQLSQSTPFDLLVIFLLQHEHKPLLSSICCIFVSAVISCFKASSYYFSLSHRFASITDREALIARPLSSTYHESLPLKETLLTTISKNFCCRSLQFLRRLLGNFNCILQRNISV